MDDASFDRSKLKEVAKDGPFTLMMYALVTDGNGVVGQVKYRLPVGEVPTQDSIREALENIRATLKGNGGEISKLRFMGRHEFVGHVMEQTAGVPFDFAVPGPDTFTLDAARYDG